MTTLRRTLIIGLALAAISTGCGDDTADELVVTEDADPDTLLRAAAERAEIIDSYRTDVFMEISIESGAFSFSLGDIDTAAATGEFRDGRSAFEMDMGALLGGFLPTEELGTDDLTMEVVTDADGVAYMRQAWLASFSDGARAPDPLTEALSTGGWIRIDASAYGLDPADVVSLQGGQSGFQLDQLDDVLLGIDGVDVDDRGAGEVRGRPTRVIAVVASLSDLSEATGGVDPRQLLGAGGDDLPADLVGSILDTPFELVLHIDDDGVPVRTEIVGTIEVAELGEELVMEMHIVTEFYDIGADDIEIEIPTDAVDVTEELAELLGN